MEQAHKVTLSSWFSKSRWAFLLIATAFYSLAILEIMFPDMPGDFGFRSTLWGDEYFFDEYGSYGLAGVRTGWGSAALLMFIYSAKRFEGGTGPS
jgi:hypothetical protein